jgi:hypothetical protein
MTLNFKFTDLGTKYLHQHNTFVIENLGKNYLRCRNTSQNIIDKLYINELIDDKEYNAGQFVLYVCYKSGLLGQGGVNLSLVGRSTDEKQSSYRLLKSMRLKQLTNMFKKEQRFICNHVITIISDNKELNKQSDMALFKRGLHQISNRLYHSDLDNAKTTCHYAVQSVVEA